MTHSPQVVPLHQPPARRVRRQRREPLWRHVIGEVLRLERRQQGRTLRDVCDEAQVSMAYLSEIERGRKEASSELLACICDALDLELAELLDDASTDLRHAAFLGEGSERPASAAEIRLIFDQEQRKAVPD